MNGHASPATQLHDVAVVNEQTGAAWYPEAAAIELGHIVIRVDSRTPPPPGELFARTASTFRISAVDGGGRTRIFAHLSFAASPEPRVFVFR